MRYSTLVAVTLFTLVGFAGHGLAGVPVTPTKATNSGSVKTETQVVSEADQAKAKKSDNKLTNWQKSDKAEVKANKDGLVNENDCWNCGYTTYTTWSYSWSWISYDVWPSWNYVWSWTPRVFTWTYLRPHYSDVVYYWAPRRAPCQVVVF